MIHGSGASFRDNRWYLTFVEALVDNGIAVLLPDKRGSVDSDGDWRSASFFDLAADAPDIAFAISVVGSVVPFREALYFEENHNIRSMGVLPGLSHAIALFSSWHIRERRQNEFWSQVADFDPLPYWDQVSQPTLVLLGGADENTPSKRSARRLRSLEKKNIAVEVYPDSDHALEPPRGSGDSFVRPEALSRIVSFIHTVDTSIRNN
jgi:pimeloyl-ACP methyl ester carboxylesterase